VEDSVKLTALKDLFYRCKFRQLLAMIELLERGDEGVQLGQGPVPTSAQLGLLKANAHYELHQIPKAIAALKAIRAVNETMDEDYLYALARLNYFDNDHRSALEIFTEIHEKSTSERHQFKSLLGIANIHYSAKDFHKVPALVERLRSFEPLEEDDERISLAIFLGNYSLNTDVNRSIPRGYFKKSLGIAANRTWNYFVNRSLFGLAAVAAKESQHQELEVTLDILRSMVDQSESLYFTYLVNEEFKDHAFSLDTEIEFDNSNKRIMVNNRWITFHERPLVYRFLETLHQRGDFTPKDHLARDLWPEEAYKPKVHDPRIFDIAKRARSLIEPYENQPTILLSGRAGYKLATT